MKSILQFSLNLKYLFLIGILWGGAKTAISQPMICPDPPMMTSFCKDACIICDIDGFTGRNSNPEDGEAPPGFCTTVVHNGQWIAFIAGTEKLSIRLDVSNCTRSGPFRGLEIGIYEGIDCDNFKLVSNCDGDVSSTQTFIAEDLTIGQYYYLVMDGNGGDMCDWTFTVLEGDTRVNPLPSSGVIQGNFEACPDVEKTFVLDYPIGATEFVWQVDGVNQFQNNPELNIAFPEIGVYTVCVTAFNACESAPPTCQQVLVKSVPPTDFGKMKICVGDNFEINDSILTETDFYEFHIILANGCDSVITVDLEVVEPSFTEFGRVNICAGDALPIGDKTFTEAGFYTEVLTNKVGCDSTVTLDLFTVECNIAGTIQANTAICQGEASGSIDFNIINGTPPFDYRWERIDKTENGAGRIENLTDASIIENLIAGTYLITVTDDFNEFDNVLSRFKFADDLAGTVPTVRTPDCRPARPGPSDKSVSVFCLVAFLNSQRFCEFFEFANQFRDMQIMKIVPVDRTGCQFRLRSVCLTFLLRSVKKFVDPVKQIIGISNLNLGH